MGIVGKLDLIKIEKNKKVKRISENFAGDVIIPGLLRISATH